MVGLQRGTVCLESHQPEWIVEAQNAMEKIREVLGEIICGCEHVGSSSVEGLKAKPIIDLVVGVKNLDEVIPFIEAFGKAGFIRRPGADVGDELFFAAGDFETDTRTHHVHVVIFNSQRWHDYIDFRDGLRQDEVLRSNYQNMKQQLALQHPMDRQAYNEGKNHFVLQALTMLRKKKLHQKEKPL